MATPSVVRALEGIVGEACIKRSPADLLAYSYDAASNWEARPEVVVLPQSVEQVSQILRLASTHRIPVTPRGAGTNLSGGSVPLMGGIVLGTARLDAVTVLDPANFVVTAQAGVVLNDLNTLLAKHNLFFPPDPQSFLVATVGGCVAENAAGPSAVKYGVLKHYLLGMTVVLASGEVVRLGGRTMKNVVGYDLSSLVCGSEGTLAVVTDATFRLLVRPPCRQTVMAAFDDIRKAGRAVHDVLSRGTLPAKIELMDGWVIRRIEERMPLGLPLSADAMLLFEMDGTTESVRSETAAVLRRCSDAGAVEVREAQDAEEANRFWTARRAGFSAVFGAAPTVMAEDVTVPTSRIPDLIERVRELSRRHSVTIVMLGHAGDGNLHPSVLTDRTDAAHYARAQQAVEGIFDTAIELNGAISGEHGIGLEKRRFLARAMQPEAIRLVKEIKKCFDPEGILNPGKIWQ